MNLINFKVELYLSRSAYFSVFFDALSRSAFDRRLVAVIVEKICKDAIM
jgi:hypothetical protein